MFNKETKIEIIKGPYKGVCGPHEVVVSIADVELLDLEAFKKALEDVKK